jgi:hypothetical protein
VPPPGCRGRRSRWAARGCVGAWRTGPWQPRESRRRRSSMGCSGRRSATVALYGTASAATEPWSARMTAWPWGHLRRLPPLKPPEFLPSRALIELFPLKFQRDPYITEARSSEILKFEVDFRDTSSVSRNMKGTYILKLFWYHLDEHRTIYLSYHFRSTM